MNTGSVSCGTTIVVRRRQRRQCFFPSSRSNFLLFLLSLILFIGISDNVLTDFPFFGCHAMSIQPSTSTSMRTSRLIQGPVRQCKVCTSSSCTPHGSEMLLDALEVILETIQEVEKEQQQQQNIQNGADEGDDVAVGELSDIVKVTKSTCLGGCGKNVIVKAYKPTIKQMKHQKLKPLKDETKAIEAAMELLGSMNVLTLRDDVDNDNENGGGGGVDSKDDEASLVTAKVAMTALERIQKRLAAGESVLQKSSPPEICSNCGAALQLYRGNCAVCGKYPY